VILNLPWPRNAMINAAPKGVSPLSSQRLHEW
jgi:hypothetical protein